jgi:FixJ family two-component response regulator
LFFYEALKIKEPETGEFRADIAPGTTENQKTENKEDQEDKNEAVTTLFTKNRVVFQLIVDGFFHKHFFFLLIIAF